MAIIAGLDRPNYFKGVVLIGPVASNDQDEIGPVLVSLSVANGGDSVIGVVVNFFLLE